MKINKIWLRGYNQFRDVEVDLVYPKGHKKEGKPLDKVCIIGQSGTGKTSILRQIKWFVTEDRKIRENIELPVPPKKSISMSFSVENSNFSRLASPSPPYLITELLETSIIEAIRNSIEKTNPLLINFPTDVFSNIDNEKSGDRNGSNGDKAASTQPEEPKKYIDFALEDIRETWEYVLNDVKEHRAQELEFKSQIADTASKDDASLEEIEQKTKEYKAWLAQQPNPLKILAETCLDPILQNLGLKTKTNFDKKTILNLGFIELQTLTGVDVPGFFWSTGTRQLVQTAVPLYQLKPKNAIVLMDEPERSLYPDMQRSIIDTYVNLAPECQFFFATHSPIIASAFEPWEIVELKFDENHEYVYREKYYTGENHVDNYKYYPEYLRWDSILHRIFDLEEEGGKKRLEALEEMAELKIRTRKLKDQGKLDTPEGKKMLQQFKALSQKLDWRYE